MRRFFTILSLTILLSSLPLGRFASAAAAESATSGHMNLAGVLVFEEHPRALITMPGSDEEMLVNEGDLIEGYTVRRIAEDQVELVKAGQTSVLLMGNADHSNTESKIEVASAATDEPAPQIKHLASAGKMKRVLVSRSAYRASTTTSQGPHFIRPILAGFVSSPFGLRMGATGGASTNHKGVDIAAPFGTPVYAAADGTVVESGWSYAKGNNILIHHDGHYDTAYFHLSKRQAEIGQTVRAGQRIGNEGTTGISSGPHLHFEVHFNGIPVNPADYIRSLSQR